MEHDPSAPIRAAVRKDGSIVVPGIAVAAMGLKPGNRVHVRVTVESLSVRAMELGVTEEEVDAIGELQLESRENVLRFLAAEGSLAKRRSFRTRVDAWRR